MESVAIKSIRTNQRSSLYAPSFIDSNGSLHLAHEAYLWHPKQPESVAVAAAKVFRDEFLAYIQENLDLKVTMIDCQLPYLIILITFVYRASR